MEFTEANAEDLPFEDGSFDAVTIAFGIRNVPRIPLALSEMRRVLKPGGRALVLEFSQVDVPLLDKIYEFYSFRVIPAMGRQVTGDAEPYQYLVESIRRFPPPDVFAQMMRTAGFARVTATPLTGGMSRCIRATASDGRRFRPPRGKRVILVLIDAARLARAGYVLAREGVLSLVNPALVPPLAGPACGWRNSSPVPMPHSRRAAVGGVERLGPSYIKLGQFLATRPDVVGPAVARDLENPPGPDAPLWAGGGRRPSSSAPWTGRWIRCSKPSARRWRRPRSPRCTSPWLWIATVPPRGGGEGAAAGIDGVSAPT